MRFLLEAKHLVHHSLLSAHEFLSSRRWPNRPENLNFEITSVCDSRCIHCPRQDMSRAMAPMPLPLFKKMIDQAAEMKIPNLCPNGFGEILTIRNLEEYFSYIKSKSHRFNIIINTNAHQMTEEKIDLFIRHGVSLLNICLDGATEQTAEAIRLNLKLNRIEENIQNLIRIKNERKLRHPKIRVGMIVLPQNRHEIDAFLCKWRGKVDYVGVDGYSNRAGSLKQKFGDGDHQNATSCCILPFKDLNIWSDGHAVICCNDWNEQHLIGDLTQQSLKDIWRSGAMTEVRRLHKHGRGNEVKICASCNIKQKPRLLRTLWT